MRIKLCVTGMLVFLVCMVRTGETEAVANQPLFYADFEDTVDAVTDQTANLHNTEPDFVPARFGKGLLCDAKNKAMVSYPTNDSIRKEAGTLEFWVRLIQDPVTDQKGLGYRSYFYLDGSEYRNGLFTVSWSDSPGDPAVLRISCGMGGRRGLNYDDNRKARDWKKGELHHFAVTWQENTGTVFYIDGEAVYTSRIEGFKIKDLNPRFMVGGGDAIDELTIYGYARTADQIRNDFRAKQPLSAIRKAG